MSGRCLGDVQTAAIRLQGMKSTCVGRCPHNAIELQGVHSVQCQGSGANKLAQAHVFNSVSGM